jgi:hypothetical protein
MISKINSDLVINIALNFLLIYLVNYHACEDHHGIKQLWMFCHNHGIKQLCMFYHFVTKVFWCGRKKKTYSCGVEMKYALKQSWFQRDTYSGKDSFLYKRWIILSLPLCTLGVEKSLPLLSFGLHFSYLRIQVHFFVHGSDDMLSHIFCMHRLFFSFH